MAATPYQTVVVSLLAGAEVVLIVLGLPVAGTAANLILPLMAALLAELVGPAPKPPTPSTRYPQVFALATTGLAWVPADAGIVSPPETKSDEAVDSAIFSV